VRRAGYVAVTLGLAALGTAAAAIGGHPVRAVAIGCGVAWAVQAGAFWHLAGGLREGRPVTRSWIAGMAARLGVGALLWLLGVLAGAPARELMVAYGLTLVIFLLLEAGWLALATAGPASRRR